MDNPECMCRAYFGVQDWIVLFSFVCILSTVCLCGAMWFILKLTKQADRMLERRIINPEDETFAKIDIDEDSDVEQTDD